MKKNVSGYTFPLFTKEEKTKYIIRGLICAGLIGVGVIAFRVFCKQPLNNYVRSFWTKRQIASEKKSSLCCFEH